MQLVMEHKKEHLLQQLTTNTLVKLAPSSIEGIGVFAIAFIAKGTKGFFSRDKSEWIKVSKKETNALPPHSRQLVENFCLYDDENFFIPEYGFSIVDLVIFLNHSDQPNIRSINDGDDFEALQNIRTGEELLIDYGTIVG